MRNGDRFAREDEAAAFVDRADWLAMHLGIAMISATTRRSSAPAVACWGRSCRGGRPGLVSSSFIARPIGIISATAGSILWPDRWFVGYRLPRRSALPTTLPRHLHAPVSKRGAASACVSCPCGPAEIQPDAAGDDLGGEAIAGVAGRSRRCHWAPLRDPDRPRQARRATCLIAFAADQVDDACVRKKSAVCVVS